MKSGHVVPHHRNQQTSYLISEPRDEEAARHGRPKATLPKDVPQAVLDTQAREAIKDLFPKMPNKDLHEIVFRAFEKVWSRMFGRCRSTLSCPGERPSRYRSRIAVVSACAACCRSAYSSCVYRL